MKIGLYHTEDFTEGGGVHKQIADTYEFDDATETIEYTQTETDYALATDRAVTISVYDGVTFIPGGSEDDKPGIKSITITPALETTPSLDSLFPFYWDEAQAQDGWTEFSENVTALSLEDGEYDVTITPTSEWRVKAGTQVAEKGQPLTFNAIVESGLMVITAEVAAEDDSKGIDTRVFVRMGE